MVVLPGRGLRCRRRPARHRLQGNTAQISQRNNHEIPAAAPLTNAYHVHRHRFHNQCLSSVSISVQAQHVNTGMRLRNQLSIDNGRLVPRAHLLRPWPLLLLMRHSVLPGTRHPRALIDHPRASAWRHSLGRARCFWT
jgi:hypothetical protein